MPDATAANEAAAVLEQCMQRQDSCGGTVECIVRGLPVGLGQPNFDKLPAVLGHAILSIGAVKGFEIGDGMAVAQAFGSDNNDAFYMTPEGTPAKRTNHSGGVLGGISDGSDLIFRAAFKPTPSIAVPPAHGKPVRGRDRDLHPRPSRPPSSCRALWWWWNPWQPLR